MKLKIRLSIEQHDQLLTAAVALQKDGRVRTNLTIVHNINLRTFIIEATKKQIVYYGHNWPKEKVITFSLDVNHYEVLRILLNGYTDRVGPFTMAIFHNLQHEQVTKQLNNQLAKLNT